MTAVMGIAHRLRLAKLLLVTDARQQQGDLAAFLEAAFRGGVDMVRLRQPGLAPVEARAILARMREVAFPHQGLIALDGPLALDGRLDPAAGSGSDALHLDTGEGAATTRPHLHRWSMIGRSTHDIDEVGAALDDPDIDYFCLGPVWSSPGGSTTGVDLLSWTARRARPLQVGTKPWFAAGGIGPRTLETVLAAGARRVCVGRAITAAEDPQQAARQLSDALRAAWREDPGAEAYAFAAGQPASGSPGRLR